MQILGLAQIEAPKQISWGFDSYACDRLSEPLAEVSFIAGNQVVGFCLNGSGQYVTVFCRQQK